MMDLMATALQFVKTPATPACDLEDVFFDTEFVHCVPLSQPLTPEVYEKTVLTRYEVKIASVHRIGTAVMLVKTNLGGYTGNARQLEHIVPYAAFGLDRLGASTSKAAHLAVFDGCRPPGRRRE
ncbi:hypothetical protein NCC49_004373 [Naganishia albida]|nr:hypothetical protein NCC49_004373 [Naganishia albida]